MSYFDHWNEPTPEKRKEKKCICDLHHSSSLKNGQITVEPASLPISFPIFFFNVTKRTVFEHHKPKSSSSSSLHRVFILCLYFLNVIHSPHFLDVALVWLLLASNCQQAQHSVTSLTLNK